MNSRNVRRSSRRKSKIDGEDGTIEALDEIASGAGRRKKSKTSSRNNNELISDPSLVEMQAEMEVEGLQRSRFINSKKKKTPVELSKEQTSKSWLLDQNLSEECRPRTEYEELQHLSEQTKSKVRKRGRGGNLMTRMEEEHGGIELVTMMEEQHTALKNNKQEEEDLEESFLRAEGMVEGANSDDNLVDDGYDDDDYEEEGNDEKERDCEEEVEEEDNHISATVLGKDNGINKTINTNLVFNRGRYRKNVKGKRISTGAKSFKAKYLAERHGKALGAYSVGNRVEAVRQLHDVSTFSPGAPQIYSSLGLMYETTAEERAKYFEADEDDDKSSFQQKVKEYLEGDLDGSLKAQVALAEKAHSAYHVAACLNRRNFSLWTRAGDVARSIADMYDEAMRLSVDTTKISGFRSLKKKWLRHTRDLYKEADRLCPSGVDIPSKLAAAHLELHELAESLNILTDLKQKDYMYLNEHHSVGERDRTDVEKNYALWLLFADLMLRIGYECTQYNRGETVEGSNAKKWFMTKFMKQYSKTFDWQEKRLQALCLALEAAAGSKSCQPLTEWISRHVADRRQKRCSASKPIEDGDDDLDVVRADENTELDGYLKVSDKNGQKCSERSDSIDLETEKEALLVKNKAEINAFDDITISMDYDKGSDFDVERQRQRSKLLKDHRNAVVNLVMKHREIKKNMQRQFFSSAKPLPPSASLQTVVEITSKLMKLCLKMGEYEGGRLAAEVLSNYFKSRVVLREKRAKELALRERRYKKRSEMTLNQMVNQTKVESDVESDEDPYLSDEDCFNSSFDSTSSSMLENMKRGVLPPEIRFLYSCCLFGLDVNEYAAIKLLDGLQLLETENVASLKESIIDTSIVPDNAWCLFQYMSDEPLCQKSAHIFVDEVLQEFSDKNLKAKWSAKLCPFFFSFYEKLLHEGEFGKLPEQIPKKEFALTFYKDRILRSILCYCRYALAFADRLRTVERSKLSPFKLPPILEKSPSEIAASVLDKIIQHKKFLWTLNCDSTLGRYSMEVLGYALDSFDIILSEKAWEREDKVHKSDFLVKMAIKMKSTVEVLFDVRLKTDTIGQKLAPRATEEAQLFLSKYPLDVWKNFPITDRWQIDDQRTLSRFMFNLCVGSNVTHFIGYKNDGYTMNRLTRLSMNREGFIGVKTDGEYITGNLHENVVCFLTTAWQKINKILPNLPVVDFQTMLDKFRDSDWFRKSQHERETIYKDEEVCSQGEVFALDCIVATALILLLVAEQERNIDLKHCLLMDVLAVVAPLTQFVNEEPFWMSIIGLGGKPLPTKAEIGDFPEPPQVECLVVEAGNSMNNLENPVKESQSPANPPLLTNLTIMPSATNSIVLSMPSVNVPTFVPLEYLSRAWNESRPSINSKNEQQLSKSKMKALHLNLKELRSTKNLESMKKCSIIVATSLIDVAGTPCCHNPFICLQQAATFCSFRIKQLDKECFWKELPSEKDCHAYDALMTIGRAYCMLVLDCNFEAVYLCEFIARVFSLRRSSSSKILDSMWEAALVYLRMLVSNVDERNAGVVWSPNLMREMGHASAYARGMFEKYGSKI